MRRLVNISRSSKKVTTAVAGIGHGFAAGHAINASAVVSYSRTRTGMIALKPIRMGTVRSRASVPPNSICGVR